MDPAKLKVVELRQELASRGLDQKGVKAVLVARLTEALEAENAETPSHITVPVSPVRKQRSVHKTLHRRQFGDSVSSESGESEQSSVEVPSQQIEAVAESVIENDNQPEEDEEMPIEQEAEKTIVSAEPVGTNTVEAAAEAPTGTSDPVPVTEVQQPSAVTEDEPMDEDSNIEQKIESTTADDDKLKDDIRQPNVEPIEENVTAALGEAAEPEEVKEEESTKSEAEPAKPEVDVETKMESCDDERTSVTQSEDNKRESESDSDRNRKRKRSRSKSSSPTVKRSRRASPVQNTDDFTNVEDEPEIDASAVLLSWFDSDLNLKVNSSEFLSARPISEGPLHMAWAGVRATHGVKEGKVSYEVLIDDLYRIRGQYDRNPNEIRCGWSVKTASLQLGETPLSFGYGGSGKKCLNNEFTDYGCKFRNRGDVIGVYLDLDSTPCKIEYTVNGESQGVAFEFEKSDLGDEALYPHILSKNTGFKVNFGGMEKSFVSKIKPKSHRDERDDRDDRRDSRRDRRSDRDSRRDRDSRSRSRSRSRSQSRSRGDRKEKSDEEEKPATNDEKPAEGDAENPTNDVDTAEAAVATSKENSDEPVAEEKVEEKSMDVVKSDENAADADGANGDSQPKDAEEEVPVEKTMLPGYEFIGKLSSEQLIPGFSRPESRKECEIILLIGLPGSGKTYWANNFVNENIDKHFNILGIQPLLSKMTISGEPRKKHVDMKWDRFIDSCIRGVNIIQDIAAKRRRNYIIDQTNVISQNQRRKIRGFGDFKRSAVVFIPDDEEYKQRLEKKIENEGKEVSEYSSDDMKANFSIPNSGCWFDEVKFVGLEGEEAKTKVAEYNEQGKKALSTHQSSYNRGSRDYNRPRRDDFRDNRDRDRRWGGGDRRYDNRSDWRSQNWRGGGGGYGGSRDRWHGGSGGGGGGGGNWANNYRGNNRYDDRGYRGGGGYSRNRDFGHDRDRRGDRPRNDSRGDHRDFREGNRDRRGEDKRHDRGVPQREKDVKQLKPQPSQVNYKSTKTEPPTQGHWNPNVVGPNANNWNNYYQQQQQQQQQPQNWGEYSQQNWMQQQQQWSQQQAQPSNNYTTQQAHQVQDWSNWQQQTQQPPPASQQQPPQQQQDVTHAGWQNWAQHAQAYGNVGDQSAPK